MIDLVLICSTERDFSAHNDSRLPVGSIKCERYRFSKWRGGGDWGLHKTEIESIDFVETFSSPKSREVSLRF
jgi:hypothetical protein